MQIGEKGLALIKSFEGCYLKAYKCPADVWTIGWGTTEPINGVKIHSGMTITQKQADELLLKNLTVYENAVNKLGVQFDQNQYDALVSFCYNLGTGIFTGTLLKSIKAKNWEDVARQISLYNKARVNGVLTELKGLTRRRVAESELLLKEVTSSNQDDKDLSNAVSKIIKSGINIDFNQWKRLGVIKLNNVPSLLIKLTSKKAYKDAIDDLVKKGVISSRDIWDKKTYNESHVRSLLIKFSSVD